MFLALQGLHDWFVIRLFFWAASRCGWKILVPYTPNGEDVTGWIIADSPQTANRILEGESRSE